MTEDSNIYVKTVEGETHAIPYVENMTAKQLKIRVKAKTGVSIDNQSLIASGREIGNEKQLSEYDITKGSTV
jgi:hypothetical protein